MSDDRRLPLDASVDQIIQAIHQVQARCRIGLFLDPDTIAHEAHRQLTRINRVAVALDVPLAALSPRCQWWPGSSTVATQTVVELNSQYIEVHRRGPSLGWNGQVELRLPRVRV